VVQLPTIDRQCSLVFDEISLKSTITYSKIDDRLIGYTESGKVATHALVFMVRGLSTKWKQTLGYFLTHHTVEAGQLSELILSCIQQLDAIGVHVRCVVCDQAATNVSALKRLGLSDQGVLTAISGFTRPLYAIFDVPSLQEYQEQFPKA